MNSNSEQMTPEEHRKQLSDNHFEMFGKNLKCTEAYKANPMENSDLFPSIIHNMYHFHGTNTAAGHKTLEITRYTNAKPDKQESKVLARLIKMQLFNTFVLCSAFVRLVFLRKRLGPKIWINKKKNFGRARLSHDEFNKFWLPISIFLSGYTVHEVIMNQLYIHFKYKYFLEPHMRFELNTGRRLELILLVDKK